MLFADEGPVDRERLIWGGRCERLGTASRAARKKSSFAQVFTGALPKQLSERFPTWGFALPAWRLHGHSGKTCANDDFFRKGSSPDDAYRIMAGGETGWNGLANKLEAAFRSGAHLFIANRGVLAVTIRFVRCRSFLEPHA